MGEAELTWGRVAMMGALGFVVGEQLEDSSAFLLFDGNITGPAIGHYQQLGQGFWEPLLLAIGICESSAWPWRGPPPRATASTSSRRTTSPGTSGSTPSA